MRGVFLGLGSNLGDRARHLDRALDLLDEHPDVTVRRVSPVYETEPVGPAGQGPYLNAAAEIETCLEPARVLGILLDVEARLGRRGRITSERSPTTGRLGGIVSSK